MKRLIESVPASTSVYAWAILAGALPIKIYRFSLLSLPDRLDHQSSRPRGHGASNIRDKRCLRSAAKFNTWSRRRRLDVDSGPAGCPVTVDGVNGNYHPPEAVGSRPREVSCSALLLNGRCVTFIGSPPYHSVWLDWRAQRGKFPDHLHPDTKRLALNCWAENLIATSRPSLVSIAR